jgi:hypothetical protein
MNTERTLTLDTIHQILSSHARGSYQLDLIQGDEAWSGATLKGSARSFKGRYYRSSQSLVKRLNDDGIQAEPTKELIEVDDKGTRRTVLGLSVGLDDGSTLWISHRGTYVFEGEDNE